MIKQLLLLVTGEFNLIEFKNLATDKTTWFNLQSKPVNTPDIKCKARAEAEDRIAILLEGEETDIIALGDIIKRGPLTAHISGVEELWRDVRAPQRSGGAPRDGQRREGEGQGQPRRRRRRRRR